MYNPQQKEKLELMLRIDEPLIKNLLLEEVKEIRKKDLKPIIKNKDRPRWSSNTKPEEKPIIDCSWPLGTDDCAICKCKKCDEDNNKVDIQFAKFSQELLNLKSTDEISTFFEKNKRYISEVFETTLFVIRTELIFKKWDDTVLPIFAANRFKNNFRKKNLNKEYDISQLSKSH